MGAGAARRLTVREERPRVCLAVGQLGLGGLERQVYLLAGGLSRVSFDVTVLSMSRGGEWAAHLRRANIRVVELDRRGRLDWRRLAAMHRVFRSLRPHIVYSFNYETSAYARLAGLLAGVPLLVAGERGIYMSRVRTAVERVLIRFTECVVCNAESIRRDLVERVGLPERKVITIRNGVVVPPAVTPEERRAIRDRLGVRENEVVAGTIARLESDKNLPLLIGVAARLRDAPVRLRFIVAGGGTDEDSLRTLIRERGLEDHVTLLGLREDARSLLAGFDLFVLTSRTEGLPNTVMEAMASGLPCVSTDVGGCRELIESGVTGYVVPLGDERALADRILEMAVNADARVVLGQAGRRRIVESYSVERLVSDIERLFRGLLDSVGSRWRGHRLSVDLVGAR